MRIVILFFTILSVCIDLSAQGLDQNIVSSLDDAHKKFTGRRNLTYEYLTNKEFDKISEIFENPLILELPTGYKENLQSFYKEEIILMFYWLGEYQNILKHVVNNTNPRGSIIETGKEQQAIIPYKNSFYDDLLKLSYENQEELKAHIKSSNLNPEEKDFLMLYLDFRLAEANLEGFDKDLLIQQAKEYKGKYQDESYNDFVSSNIDIGYKTSNFGLGSTLFIGSCSFTENLGDNISGGMPIGGIINAAYKNLILDFQFTGSLISRVKQDFTFKELWEKNSRTTLAFGSLNLGYAIINNDKMMITPSIGMASTNISSYVRAEDGEAINLKIDNTPVLHTSITFDYKLKHKIHISEYKDRLISEFDNTYWIFRLKAGFITPNFEDDNNVFKGNVFYVGAGIGIFTYPATAIKKK